jgi:hypothetical protein
MRIRLRFVVAALVCWAPVKTVQAVVIDDYSVGSISLVRDAAAIIHAQSGLDPNHVAGGNRNMTVGWGGGSAGQSIVIDGAARTMTLASGPTSLGYFSVEYGSVASPLGIDLAANGETLLQVIFKRTGGSDALLTQPPNISVSSPSGNRQLAFAPPQPLGDGRYLSRAAFSDHSTVDFHNLSQLSFNFVRYPRDYSLTLYEIKSVQIPEPAAASLGIAGLILLSAAARRR